jgi:hypothetical protein
MAINNKRNHGGAGLVEAGNPFMQEFPEENN